MFQYLLRLTLLTLGVALATMGLLTWQAQGFALATLWPFSNAFQPHPVHLLVLGIALIPPSLWDIFMLETRRNRSTEQHGST